MTNLKDIFAEWQNNPTFRESFKNNPVLALQEAGFEVSEADLEKIKAMVNIDKSQNEKLDDRISK